MNSEEALCHLGMLVERGKKTFVNTCSECGYRNPEETATQEINKILLIVPEEKLFSDKDFSLSLHLGLLWLFREDKKNFENNFLKRLLEIFPQTLPEKLYKYAEELEVERAKGLLNQNEEEKKEAERKLREKENLLYAKRKKIVSSAIKHLNERRPPAAGTESILVPCPKCGLEKRCFKNTKRFRCKRCGYENPTYRYGSAS